MLFEVGGKTYKINWKHEPIYNKVDEWLSKNASKLEVLDEGTKASLLDLLRIAAPGTRQHRNRNGFTTCIVEETLGDGAIKRTEYKAECSKKDRCYLRERGRTESLSRAAAEIAEATTEYLDERKNVRAEIFRQYEARKLQHNNSVAANDQPVLTPQV